MSFEDTLVAHIVGGASRSLSEGEAAAVMTFMQDSYGVGLSGSRVDLLPAVKAACLTCGQPQARVWGTGEAGDAASVALVNAYQIHNQEWDCVHEPAVVHPMAVILAALTAVAERAGGVNGDLLLRAVSTGVDVATAIGMCAGQPMRFFRPGWCGGLGAVAGLAVLCGADERQARNALGLVYSSLGGTMQAHVEGSMALPLQIAFSARNAVTAFDLAMAGIDGPQAWLTGGFGFFRQIESGRPRERRIRTTRQGGPDHPRQSQAVSRRSRRPRRSRRASAVVADPRVWRRAGGVRHPRRPAPDSAAGQSGAIPGNDSGPCAASASPGWRPTCC